MTIFAKITANFEKRAKLDTLVQLRRMSDAQLIDCGISPALLSEGVKAWPWREAAVVEPLVTVQYNKVATFQAASNNVDTTAENTEDMAPMPHGEAA